MSKYRIHIKAYSWHFFVLSTLFTLIMCFFTSTAIVELGEYEITVIEVLQITTRQDRIDYHCSARSIIQRAADNQWFSVVFPLMVSLPYIFTFFEEIESNMYRTALIRTTKRKYINRMFFNNAVFGAGAVTLGYSIFTAVIYILFPHTSEISDYETGQPQVFFHQTLKTDSELWATIVRLFTFFVFAVITAQLCLVLVLVFRNIFRGVGIPMVMFYMMDKIAYQTVTNLNRTSFDEKNYRWFAMSPAILLGSIESWFYCFEINLVWYYVICAALLAILYFICRFVCLERVMI